MRLYTLVKRCVTVTFFLSLYLFTRSVLWSPLEDGSSKPYDKPNDKLGQRGVEIETYHFSEVDITPNVEPEQLDWQEVSGSLYHFSIYSAYSILPSESPEVLIIGVKKILGRERIKCQYYFRNESMNYDSDKDIRWPPNQIQIPGNVEVMKENWNRPYSGVFIRCPLASWKNMRPVAISILINAENETIPSNKIEINYQYEPKIDPRHYNEVKYNYTFSVCVLPTYKYNEVFHLLEWIEFYKMMGVEQFTFFNVSFGPDASCVLNDLMEGGDPAIKMNVHPWHKNPIKTFGQIRGNCAECSLSAGTNDCVYRHRGRLSKYMVFVDLDEFLAPRQENITNFQQLVNLIDSKDRKRNVAQYMFKNGFFVPSREDDPILLKRCSSYLGQPLRHEICMESFLMKKVKRENFHRYLVRSKYIIKPESVKQAGNHMVWAFDTKNGPQSTFKVPEEIAALRHYRQVDHRKESTIDRIDLGFGLKFVEKLAKRVEYFRERCKVNLKVKSDDD